MSALLSRPASSSRASASAPAAPLGATILLTATAAVAGAGVIAAALVLAVPAKVSPELRYLTGLINQQNQNAKTAAFLLAFAVVLPASVLTVPRLADRLAARFRPHAVTAAGAGAAGSFAAMILAVRLVPGHSGLARLLVGIFAWAVLVGGAGVLLWRGGGRWADRLERVDVSRALALCALLGFGTLLCLTRLHRLGVAAVIVSLAVMAALGFFTYARPQIGLGRLGAGVEVIAGLVIVLAVPDVVVFWSAQGPVAPLTLPGIVQSQHDYFLGAVNQLMAHGTLLVNAPLSQYGVGDLYFLAGWFHLTGIGYGAFALLDGILTALYYLTAYAVLRVAGVGRWLAIVASGFAVCVFVYHLDYPVGVLPEMGPLRFGLPLPVVLGAVAGWRWPQQRRWAQALMLATLAVSAVWSVEAFVYTLATSIAIAGLEASLVPAGERLALLKRRLAGMAAAIVIAHAVFALATLAGSGSLPDWGQYFAYVHSFLLGGKAGEVSYGFEAWSPGLAQAALLLGLGATVALLLARARDRVLAEPVRFLGLGACAAYGIITYSYSDNRSSTYVLAYLAVPTFLAVIIGIAWLQSEVRVGAGARRGALVAAAGVGALMLAAAWPSIGSHFSDSALAKARPGGGLRAAVHRLLHPPALDGRTPIGVHLLEAYVPGRRPIVVMAQSADLAIEILMQSRRSNLFSIGDTGMDDYVPGVWLPRLSQDLNDVRPGMRMLTDTYTLRLATRVAADPSLDPVHRPLLFGENEMEWIVQRLQRRFRLVPVVRAPYDLVVAELASR